VVGWILLEPGT